MPLQGRTFLVNIHSSGTIALASSSVIANHELRFEIRSLLTMIAASNGGRRKLENVDYCVDAGLSHHPITPIFSFVVKTQYTRLYTGDHHMFENLRAYIIEKGGDIKEADIYVPFSDHRKLISKNPGVLIRELGFVTTSQQFIETFGAPPSFFRAKR